MNIIMSVKPDAPINEKWALHISTSEEHRTFCDPDLITLQGFETSFDAWAFAFCHFGIDICSTSEKKWTFKPEEIKPQQIKMF